VIGQSKLLLRIWEVAGSNLDPETGYAEAYSDFPQSRGECQDNILKADNDRFLPNPFQFIVHLSPFH
jgi:hypothetical protein